MDLAAVRDCFPGTRDHVFLDAASVGLMPMQAASALTRLASDLVCLPARNTAEHHIALDRTGHAARTEIAQLIGARPSDVALVESTTQGLEILVAAIPLRRGDKVLVGETEFLGLAVPWLPKRDADGITIEVVPSRGGRLLVEDFAHAIDGRTRLILLSSVQWTSGFRVDLPAFSELARTRNVLLLVDAIQQLGAIRFDVSQTPVDFVVCGGHKWLNAPVGRGFLYIAPSALDKLLPPPRGYLNAVTPPEGWASYFATPTIPAVRDYTFMTGARAYAIGGTSSYPGNVVLGASVGLFNAIGPDAIQRHVFDLTELLMERLRCAGATIVTVPEREHRSGIVSFTLGDGAERDRELLLRLWDLRIVVSQRYTAGIGGLRASVHLFNNEEDVSRLAEAVAAR
jgi:selenocysteine lyase/cysteine desulfurase